MKWLVVVLLVGLAGCIPPKPVEQPVIQPPVVTVPNTPTMPPPITNPQPNIVSPTVQPSPPNPYLNPTQYPPLDSYYPEKPNLHNIPWNAGYQYYPPLVSSVPVIVPTENETVFWTGTSLVTIQ
jgi:hypothetical protein